MTLRLQFTVFVILSVCSSSAIAQEWRPLVSTTCAGLQNADPQALEKRKRELEATTAAAKVRIDVAPASSGQDSASQTVDRELAKQALIRQQGELIELLYKQECLRPDLSADPDTSRGEGSTIDISTFYATNRKLSGLTELVDFYGSEDTRRLALGQATISIPSKHRMGELELPHFWKLERNPDPNKHFVVESINPLETNVALAQIQEAIGKSSDKVLLLFVHGFNVSFYEAALRTGQLAHDLRFPGIAMFYSWPSAGSFWGYLHDEESAELANRIFDELLEDISQLDIQGVYIVAHSMGNRIVSSALASRVQSNRDVKKIRELLLAAPDINAEVFKDEIAPKLKEMQSAHKTIYASSSDLALSASKVVHGFRRVGESTGGVLTFPEIETIDASKAAPLIRAFGHSYVLDSINVLNDVEDLLVWQRPLSQRTLTKAGHPPDIYWQLK